MRLRCHTHQYAAWCRGVRPFMVVVAEGSAPNAIRRSMAGTLLRMAALCSGVDAPT